jgi:hypothetical protein
VTLLIAPTVAVLGLIATFLVVRARYREKESLYETLRAERQKQIQHARLRAMGQTQAAASPAPAPPAAPVADPVAPVEPAEPATGIAAIREQAIHRDRLRNVTGIVALVVSLVLVLLGILLAIAESHTA